MSSVSPSDDDLASALKPLRSENPTTGAAKLLALLLQANPTWSVSEKRLRKALQREGLSISAAPSKTAEPSASGEFPESHIVPSVDPQKWTKNVQVKDFGPRKGKGLVSIEAIEENAHIWVEDPLLTSPETELDDLQRGASACLYCAKPLNHSGSGFLVECKCSGMYCNRLCSTRGGPAHAFLCPNQNPASSPFLSFVRAESWKAPGALARYLAILFSLGSKGAKKELEDVAEFLRGLAGLGLDKRVRVMSNWQASQTASETVWKRTHELFLEAFYTPKSPAHTKLLAKLKGKAELPADIDRLFSTYDGFLLGLGKMSLNMEAHGGLYILHSHLNHSCSPNVSVRHITPNNVQRITLIARSPIKPGEELFVSYVDPSGDVRKRRRELKEWGFGECDCTRCVEEEKSMPEQAEEEKGKGELEDELRGFLGV